MKHVPLTTTLAFLAGLTPAMADPGFMLGGTVTFGAAQQPDFGITARLLENNRKNESSLGAGVTYFLGSRTIGVDVFAGYVFDQGAFGFGYDLVQGAPVVSLGLVNTKD